MCDIYGLGCVRFVYKREKDGKTNSGKSDACFSLVFFSFSSFSYFPRPFILFSPLCLNTKTPSDDDDDDDSSSDFFVVFVFSLPRSLTLPYPSINHHLLQPSPNPLPKPFHPLTLRGTGRENITTSCSAGTGFAGKVRNGITHHCARIPLLGVWDASERENDRSV